MSNRKRARSKTHTRQMNNNTCIVHECIMCTPYSTHAVDMLLDIIYLDHSSLLQSILGLYNITLYNMSYNCSYMPLCYKTRVWTDFGQGQGQPDIYKYYNYQSTTDIGLGDKHVTWKSCDRVQNGLEGSGRVQRQSQGQKITSRDMGSSWCTHGVHMYSGD